MSDRILLVEDDRTQRLMTQRLCEKLMGCTVLTASHGLEAIGTLEMEEDIALVLMDVQMPVMDGLTALKKIRARHAELPVIMLTGSSQPDDIVAAMRAGATDFLPKPADPERLRVSIQNALRLQALAREVARLSRGQGEAIGFRDLIGHDKGLADITRMGRKAAFASIPVLISGETGTGKEMVARAIHGESPRARGPFVAVNCGAIPEKLVESTLFGHEKGAFTGAIAKALGKFREADGGTIFLDEVGELPPEAQVKLLRVLQQHEVEPVGAGRTVPVNIRVISATHRDLREDVASGRFREDLYFRLHVLSLAMPPLRERAEDIPPLASHLLDRFATSDRLPFKRLSPEAKALLQRYDWPGNVRELANTLHRALVLSEHEVLEATDFPECHRTPSRMESLPALSGGASPSTPLFLNADGTLKPLRQLEEEAIRFALSHTKQNATQAAAALGIAKSTLYRHWGKETL